MGGVHQARFYRPVIVAFAVRVETYKNIAISNSNNGYKLSVRLVTNNGYKLSVRLVMLPPFSELGQIFSLCRYKEDGSLLLENSAK